MLQSCTQLTVCFQQEWLCILLCWCGVCVTLTLSMRTSISEQWGDELQAGLHVLVDVAGPALTLMQAPEELDGGLQQHSSPGAAQGLPSQQVTGHAPHLQVTQRHL